jgi:hypothetical protein
MGNIVPMPSLRLAAILLPFAAASSRAGLGYPQEQCTSLTGRHWRVIVVQGPPYIQVFNERAWRDNQANPVTVADFLPRAQWKGYMIDYLDELRDRCTFEYTLFIPGELDEEHTHDTIMPTVSTNYTTLNAGAYSQGEKDVKAGFADFYWAAYYITPERLAGLSVTAPFSSEPMVLVGRVLGSADSGKGSNWKWFTTKLTYSFDRDMWVVVILSPLLAAVVFWMLEFGHYSKDFKWDDHVTFASFRRDLMHSFWLATGAITGAQGHRPSTPAAKFFGVFWAIYAVILYANYTASTTSMLVAPPSVMSIKSFKHLKQGNIPVCVKLKTAYYQRYLKVVHPDLNYVYEYKNKTITYGTDLSGAMMDGICDAAIDTQGFTQVQVYDRCPLIKPVVTLLDGPKDFGVSFRKELSGARDDVSYFFIKMQSAGSMTAVRLDWFGGECTANTQGSGRMKLKDFLPTLYIFLIVPAAWHLIRKAFKVFWFKHKMPKHFCDLLIRDYDSKEWIVDDIVLEWAYKQNVRNEINPLVFGFLQAKDAKAALEWKKNGVAIEVHDAERVRAKLQQRAERMRKKLTKGVKIVNIASQRSFVKRSAVSKGANAFSAVSKGANALRRGSLIIIEAYSHTKGSRWWSCCRRRNAGALHPANAPAVHPESTSSEEGLSNAIKLQPIEPKSKTKASTSKPQLSLLNVSVAGLAAHQAAVLGLDAEGQKRKLKELKKARTMPYSPTGPFFLGDAVVIKMKGQYKDKAATVTDPNFIEMKVTGDRVRDGGKVHGETVTVKLMMQNGTTGPYTAVTRHFKPSQLKRQNEETTEVVEVVGQQEVMDALHVEYEIIQIVKKMQITFRKKKQQLYIARQLRNSSVRDKMLAWRRYPVAQWEPLNVCGWIWSLWLRQAKLSVGQEEKGSNADISATSATNESAVTKQLDSDWLARALPTKEETKRVAWLTALHDEEFETVQELQALDSEGWSLLRLPVAVKAAIKRYAETSEEGKKEEGVLDARKLEYTPIHELAALPRAAAYAVKYRVTGRMLQCFDTPMWKLFGISAAFDQTVMEAELQLADIDAQPKTWKQVIHTEQGKKDHGRLELWWGGNKELYLKQMEALHSVVVQARRFNTTRATKKNATGKQSHHLLSGIASQASHTFHRHHPRAPPHAPPHNTDDSNRHKELPDDDSAGKQGSEGPLVTTVEPLKTKMPLTRLKTPVTTAGSFPAKQE